MHLAAFEAGAKKMVKVRASHRDPLGVEPGPERRGVHMLQCVAVGRADVERAQAPTRGLDRPGEAKFAQGPDAVRPDHKASPDLSQRGRTLEYADREACSP